MKIFVTGATGFIGTHLCRRLINDGHEVTALLRTPSKKRLLPKGVTMLKGDLSLFKDINLELPSFDGIIHLAGVIHADSREGYFEYNFHAVKDLAECILRQSWKPKRILFASSLAAAGPSDGANPLTEKDPLRPVDAYGEAKKEAENYLETISIPTTSFRPAIVLGPGDENSLTLFKMAKLGIGVKVASMSQLVSFVDIDDLVDAVVKMQFETGKDHKRYFISYPDFVSIPQLWEVLGEAFGKKLRIVPLPKTFLYGLMKVSTFLARITPGRNQLDRKQYQQMVTPAFVCSSEKLQRELDWKPSNDILTTVKKALAGYRDLGMV